MAEINIPNIPDVSSKLTMEDPQLRAILTAIKITLEQITGATAAELTAFLNEKNG